MNSPAHDIALYLAECGLGAFAGAAAWSIAVSREPENPPEAITVYDTSGGPPMPDIALRQPTIQIRVRGAGYEAAHAKAEAVFDVLTRETTREIGGHRYIGIWATSDIGSIGRDDNERHLLTMNFRIERQPLDNSEGEGE